MINDGAAVFTPGISERRSGVSKWSHQDYLGSTKALTNSSETVTDTRQYDAFGLQTGSTGSNPTPFGFAGGWGYQSDETGLQLLGHRYYDPSTGRFLTRDPVKDGRNWYGYCDNNPIKSVDPSGLYRLIVHGDTKGVPGAGIGDWWVMPQAGPGDVELQKDAPKEMVLLYLIFCDEFYFYGHGVEGEGGLCMENYTITPEDIRMVVRMRQMLGIRKMKTAKAFSCFSAVSSDLVNSWLEMTEEFTGYPDLTAETFPDAIPHINPCQTFQTPIGYNPGIVGARGGHSKKGTKKAGKGKNVRTGKTKIG